MKQEKILGDIADVSDWRLQMDLDAMKNRQANEPEKKVDYKKIHKNEHRLRPSDYLNPIVSLLLIQKWPTDGHVVRHCSFAVCEKFRLTYYRPAGFKWEAPQSQAK